MAGALEGIRVVDLTAMFNGPLCTMILADQGADVIKVEPPGRGDIIREFGPRRADVSGIFQAVNRNKRSVVIDLKQERGAELVRRLAEGADVFVQNYRPGVVERLGIGPDELRGRDPELVYTSIRAFGASGPLAARPAFDSIIQAVSGMAASQADESGTPRLVQNAVCDKLTGLQAAQAITAALFARERGAGGQHLEVSMLDASVSFLWMDVMQNHVYLDDDEEPAARAWPRAIETRDGHVLVSGITDEHFAGICRALGDAELARDERYAKLAQRSRNLAQMNEEFRERARAFTTAELCARLEAEDAPHAAVTALEELAEHPQVVANGSLVVRESDAWGRMRVPRPVEQLPATPSSIRFDAPRLGEHTQEVLEEVGVSPEELGRLRSLGTLG